MAIDAWFLMRCVAPSKCSGIGFGCSIFVVADVLREQGRIGIDGIEASLYRKLLMSTKQSLSL